MVRDRNKQTVKEINAEKWIYRKEREKNNRKRKKYEKNRQSKR